MFIGYLFYISKSDKAIYAGTPSLHHQHHIVLFIFTFVYLKQTIWIL
jgi:hypothetical protein